MAMTIVLSPGKVIQAQDQGAPAPDFEVELAGGGTFKLSEQRGKVVLVFMFGNTCPSCLAVGPAIEADIYQNFSSDPAFVAVGLDVWDGSETSVNGFASSTGISFPLGIKAGFVENEWESDYDKLHVVDQDGILVFKGNENANKQIAETAEAIEQALMTLSSGGPSAERTDREVGLYPVPASTHVRFSAPSPVSEIRIYDMTGMLVLTRSYEGMNIRESDIGIGHLAEGMYFFSLEAGGDTETGKFLIQR